MEALLWESGRIFAQSDEEKQSSWSVLVPLAQGERPSPENITVEPTPKSYWTQNALRQYQLCIPFFELPLLFHLPTESSPSDSSVSTPSSYSNLSEVFGRKRKKRTSIETNIRLTLEKRFQDVSGSSRWERVGPLV